MPSSDIGLQIRPAKESDASVVLDFIRKLAEYGDISSEATVTEADVRDALFGPRPVAEALLAYVGDEPAGFAVFSFTFSSFMGKPGIYVEDLFVEHRFRGHGVGKALDLTLAATRSRARLWPPGMVGVELERASHGVLPGYRRRAHGGMDHLSSDRRGPRAPGCSGASTIRIGSSSRAKT